MNLETLLAKARERRYIILDVETTGLDPLTDDLLTLSLGWEDMAVVDVNPNLDNYKELFLDESITKVGQNIKFDLEFIGQPISPLWDTMLIGKIIDNYKGSPRPSLAYLAEKYCGHIMNKKLRLEFPRYKKGETIPDRLLQYAKDDIIWTDRVLKEVNKIMRQTGLEKISKLECATIPVIASMEMKGIYLDKEKWMELHKKTKEEREVARNNLNKFFDKYYQTDMFGYLDINYDSPLQLKEALHKIGHPVPDTNKDTINELPEEIRHPIRRYRQVSKAVTTFGENYLRFIHPKTGRVHSNIFQLHAASGRMSFRTPNLQQIKKQKEYRNCFRAEKEDWTYVIADFNQEELRIQAELSKEPEMVKTYQNDGDIHQLTADLLGIDRTPAKNINFALTYGAQYKRFALMAECSIHEAVQYIEKLNRTYPKLMAYLKKCGEQAWKKGYIDTLGGRRRFFDTSDSDLEWDIRREGANHRVQGTASDIMKQSLVLTHNRLDPEVSYIVHAIHDEEVIECRKDVEEEVKEIVTESMLEAEREYLKVVPSAVDVIISDTWH